jgi:tRNA-(ms[2]io[6]A)-hydroxylase
MQVDISHIIHFLGCKTPVEWCEHAVLEQETLLIDHAHCEKKAASTAIAMLFRYPQYDDLVYALSRIAREELRHFEKVISILKKRGIAFRTLKPARYAEGLLGGVSTKEPERLIDLLITSAFIEARSCERFAAVIPYFDDELQDFYSSLLVSEERHYQLYLKFATQYAEFDIQNRIDYFRQRENALIMQSDQQFRFHSGLPNEWFNSESITKSDFSVPLSSNK